jgi:hypothetical protein
MEKGWSRLLIRWNRDGTGMEQAAEKMVQGWSRLLSR